MIWCLDGKELLCTFSLDVTNYNHIAQATSYSMSRHFIYSFFTGAAKYQRVSWIVKYANFNNFKEIFREQLNNESIALFRFADDCFIFANSEQVIEKILTKIN